MNVKGKDLIIPMVDPIVTPLDKKGHRIERKSCCKLTLRPGRPPRAGDQFCSPRYARCR